MPIKLTYDYVESYINEENTLISKNYINSKALLEIRCHKCFKVFKQCFSSYHRGHRCVHCARHETGLKIKGLRRHTSLCNTIRSCYHCNQDYIPKRKKQKLCSSECTIQYSKREERKVLGKINGKKGGLVSAAKQVRRSQAEIHFANLCIEHFGGDNILCNVPFFKDKNGNYWDADIIIKNINVAVLYNGIWHYKQVRKNHNLAQVQARDKIKESVIKNNGYTYHIVKDMGKFNKQFVEDQFWLFIHKQKFKECLQDI